MINLFTQNKGGVLADEMGLGKTIQVLAFILTLFHNSLAERILILSPLSVIFQWEEEIKKMFYDIFNFQEDLDILLEFKSNSIHSKKIYILGYDHFKIKCKKNKGILSIPLDCVFLDEGHKIKNKDTQISILCKKINCDVRYVISGTPIQNNLTELWSIFDFVNSSLLGSFLDFKEEFVKNIKENNDLAYKYSILLRSLIEPFILRRLKKDVNAQLPGKKDKVLFCSLTPTQNNLYFDVLSRINRKTHIDIQKNGKELLGDIDHLRKVCNHPRLIINRDQHIINSCSKMIALFDLLKKWKLNKNKVLIFTQTIQMQDLLILAFEHYNQNNLNNSESSSDNFTFLKMNGTMPQVKRKQTIEEFNENASIFCFLLTTRVGGLGLNLVGADRIVIYDPDWNPTVDSQAKERIYRYGQKSDVEIYRLVCRNTLEEKIYQKQIYKDCLSKKILTDPMTFIKKDMTDIFLYGIPMDDKIRIVNDKNFDLVEDEFVEVKKEDMEEFNELKTFNSKSMLTGKELIELIVKRESGINDNK